MDQEEEHSSVKKHRNKNCGQKKIVFGGPKENGARKASRKVMRAFGRMDFALAHHQRCQAVTIAKKGKGKDQKGMAKEGAYPQSGFATSENIR